MAVSPSQFCYNNYSIVILCNNIHTLRNSVIITTNSNLLSMFIVVAMGIQTERLNK